MSIVKVYLLQSFSYDELRDIANFTKQHEEFRRSGKTALVASTDLTLGLGRMYDTLVEIENLSHSVKVFRPMDEAIKWLVRDIKSLFESIDHMMIDVGLNFGYHNFSIDPSFDGCNRCHDFNTLKLL